MINNNDNIERISKQEQEKNIQTNRRKGPLTPLYSCGSTNTKSEVTRGTQSMPPILQKYTYLMLLGHIKIIHFWNQAISLYTHCLMFISEQAFLPSETFIISLIKFKVIFVTNKMQLQFHPVKRYPIFPAGFPQWIFLDPQKK